jgi:hypothetical protein
MSAKSHPSVQHNLCLLVSLGSNIHLCLTVQVGHFDLMRHTSSTVAPPLQYALQELNGSCSLGDGRRPSLETAPPAVILQDCQYRQTLT